MLGGALILWLAAAGAPEIEEGTTLRAGTHSAAVLLEACEILDRRPTVTSNSTIAQYAVTLRVPLEIRPEVLESLKVALRMAGLYRIDYLDREGKAFAYVTADPRVPPREERGFEVAVVTLRHIDAEFAARFLNEKVADLEKSEPPDRPRTRFVAYPRTGQLVVRYASAERLASYRELLTQIDLPPPAGPRIVLREYFPRRSRAQDLVDVLLERWKEEEDQTPIRVVAPRSRNVLLLRLEEPQWARVQEILAEIDAKPPVGAHRKNERDD